MLNSCRSKRRSQNHICLGLLFSATREHQEHIANQYLRLDKTLCKFHFPRNSFSGNEASDLEQLELHESESDLMHHYLGWKSIAIFLQSPYPEHYPSWFIDNISNFDLGYAGYGISLSDYVDGQFNTSLIKASKYLLASSEYEVQGYKKSKSVGAKVIFTGNPLMYEIRRAIQIQPELPQTHQMKLLWAPHWSRNWIDGSRGFARWQITVGPILDFVLANPGSRVIFRPHPILREAIINAQNEGGISQNRESIKSWDSETDAIEIKQLLHLLCLSNVELSTSTLLDDVISCTHLITDGVSLIAYWATTGKPMLVIRDYETPMLNSDGRKLLDLIDQAGLENEISNWLDTAASKNELVTNSKIVELSEDLFPTFTKSPMSLFLDSI